MSRAKQATRGHGPAGRGDDRAVADDVTDPTLQAEIANPGASNPPTGAEAAPGDAGGRRPARARRPWLHSDDAAPGRDAAAPPAGDAPAAERRAGGADAAEGAGAT